MPLRPFKFPHDIEALIALTVEAFQFPQHDAWSVPTYLGDLMAPQVAAIRRIWPLVRLARIVQPSLRHLVGGFFWEEDGQIVAGANIMRLSCSQSMELGNVGVIPSYRGRGLARKIVNACIDLARQWKMHALYLNVISQNFPAIALYENVGFQSIGYSEEMSYLPLYSEWTAPLFPPDYRLKPIGFGQGTAYADLARFVDTNPPPVLSDFQSPLLLRWLAPRFFRLSQTHYRAWAVWHQSAGVVAAFDIMAQMGGTTAKMLLHPQHETLAPLVLQTLIAEAEQAQSGTIISLSLPQRRYYDAALQVGFSSDFRYVRMRLTL